MGRATKKKKKNKKLVDDQTVVSAGNAVEFVRKPERKKRSSGTEDENFVFEIRLRARNTSIIFVVLNFFSFKLFPNDGRFVGSEFGESQVGRRR